MGTLFEEIIVFFNSYNLKTNAMQLARWKTGALTVSYLHKAKIRGLVIFKYQPLPINYKALSLWTCLDRNMGGFKKNNTSYDGGNGGCYRNCVYLRIKYY